MKKELVVLTLTALLVTGMLVTSSYKTSRHGYGDAEDPDHGS
jgi:hypothetical protein